MAVLLAGVLLPGCPQQGGAAKPKEEPAKTVRIHTVGRADIDDILSYPADLRPSAEVKVFSMVPDRIVSFPWEDGAEIEKGERIAIIRTEGLSQGVAQLDAQLEALDIQVKNYEDELNRLKGLLDGGAVPKAQVDRAEAAYLAAVAQRQAMKFGKNQLAVTASDGVIRAPMSGIVADKMVEVGDMAAPAIPLCRVMAVDTLELRLRVVERDVPKVSVGQEVVLHLDAYPDRTFTGKVAVVLPYLDRQTRTNTVEVKVDNPKDEKPGKRWLKPGMFGRAEIVVGRRKQVLIAPAPALLLDNRVLEKQKEGEQLRKAFIVDKDNVARQRVVKLGARRGSDNEILEGLKEGDRLIVRGQHGLKDGQRVEIVEAAKE